MHKQLITHYRKGKIKKHNRSTILFVIFFSQVSSQWLIFQVTLMDSLCSRRFRWTLSSTVQGDLKCLPVSLAPVIAIDAFSTPSVLLIWVGVPGSQDGGSCIDHTAMSMFSLTFASLFCKQLGVNLRIYHKDILILVFSLHLMTSENTLSDWYGRGDWIKGI